HLSLEAGYAVWSVLILAAAVLSWWALAPGDRPLRGVQLAMLFVPYPVALGLWLGQVVAVQAAAVALCFVLLRRGHDLAAGAALVALQLGVAALALLAARPNRSRPEVAIAAGLLGSLLATPFLHLNDHLLLFPAAWLALRAFPSVGAVVPLLLGYVLLCLCTP